MIQTTTLDPGESYGGKIVLQKAKAKKPVSDYRINITWNGEVYPFGLHVPKKGEPAILPIRPPSRSRAPKVAAAPAGVPTSEAPAMSPAGTSAPVPAITTEASTATKI